MCIARGTVCGEPLINMVVVTALLEFKEINTVFKITSGHVIVLGLESKCPDPQSGVPSTISN